MRVIILPDEEHFDYLQYVFHQHCTGGLKPDELAIAGGLWNFIRNAKQIDPQQPEGPEIIKVPGPLSVVHHGDMSVPVSPEQAARLQAPDPDMGDRVLTGS